MAAAEAALLHVLTPGAYERLHAANRELMGGCERVISATACPPTRSAWAPRAVW